MESRIQELEQELQNEREATAKIKSESQAKLQEVVSKARDHVNRLKQQNEAETQGAAERVGDAESRMHKLELACKEFKEEKEQMQESAAAFARETQKKASDAQAAFETLEHQLKEREAELHNFQDSMTHATQKAKLHGEKLDSCEQALEASKEAALQAIDEKDRAQAELASVNSVKDELSKVAAQLSEAQNAELQACCEASDLRGRVEQLQQAEQELEKVRTDLTTTQQKQAAGDHAVYETQIKLEESLKQSKAQLESAEAAEAKIEELAAQLGDKVKATAEAEAKSEAAHSAAASLHNELEEIKAELHEAHDARMQVFNAKTQVDEEAQHQIQKLEIILEEKNASHNSQLEQIEAELQKERSAGAQALKAKTDAGNEALHRIQILEKTLEESNASHVSQLEKLNAEMQEALDARGQALNEKTVAEDEALRGIQKLQSQHEELKAALSDEQTKLIDSEANLAKALAELDEKTSLLNQSQATCRTDKSLDSKSSFESNNHQVEELEAELLKARAEIQQLQQASTQLQEAKLKDQQETSRIQDEMKESLLALEQAKARAECAEAAGKAANEQLQTQTVSASQDLVTAEAKLEKLEMELKSAMEAASVAAACKEDLLNQLSEKDALLEQSREAALLASTNASEGAKNASDVEDLKHQLSEVQDEAAQVRLELTAKLTEAAQESEKQINNLRHELDERIMTAKEANERAQAAETALDAAKLNFQEQVATLEKAAEASTDCAVDGNTGASMHEQLQAANAATEDMRLQLESTQRELSQVLAVDTPAGMSNLRIKDLEQALAQAEEQRRCMQQEYEVKMQNVTGKAKDYLRQMQEKHEQSLAESQEACRKAQEAEATTAAALAEARQAATEGLGVTNVEGIDCGLQQALESMKSEAQEAKTEACTLRTTLDSLREQLAERESELARAKEAVPELELQGADPESCKRQVEELQVSLDSATADADSLKKEVQRLQAALDAATTEIARTKEESEGKVAEVVRKARDHVRQLQGKLEESVSEAEEAGKRCKEHEVALRQQQEKATKYKQLMGQANTRISDSDVRIGELKRSLELSDERYAALKEQIVQAETAMNVPSREDIKQIGIVLAVEDNDGDVWFLLGSGEDMNSKGNDGKSRRRWWQASELDVEELPTSLQARWRGTEASLRSQLADARRTSCKVQEDFDAYKQRASLALQNSAQHSEEARAHEKRAEKFGEQLQQMAQDLQRAQADRAAAQEALVETRRRLQEEASLKGDAERNLDVYRRDAEKRMESAIADCRSAASADLQACQNGWAEQELSFRQSLDLAQAKCQSLKEEVEGLREQLARSPVLEVPISSPQLSRGSTPRAGSNSNEKSEDVVSQGATPTSLTPSTLVNAPPPPPIPPPAVPSAVSSPEPVASPREISQPEVAAAPQNRVKLTGMIPPGPAHALSEDIRSLRSQVRHLEISLDEERHQHTAAQKDCDRLQAEIREKHMQLELQKKTEQTTQMEYIRNVFRRFVESMPPGNAEYEHLVPVLMTFFQFSSEELQIVQKKRQQAAAQSQGIFASLGWRS